MSILSLGHKYYLLENVPQLRQDLISFINDPSDEYRESVTGAIRQRERRVKRVAALSEILMTYAIKLDDNRVFPHSLRIKLWNAPNGHICKICNKQITTFDQAAVDHKIP
jgi:hypothetical protein